MLIGNLKITPTTIKGQYNKIQAKNVALDGSVRVKDFGGYHSWNVQVDFLTKSQRDYIYGLNDTFIFEDEDGYRCYAKIEGNINETKIFLASGEWIYTLTFNIIEVVQ
ncbi:MAG: hypothetical protein ACP6IS_12430 [Candidatus Asgardarchaeia archaeon]